MFIEALKTQLPAMQSCYERSLTRDPHLVGTLEVFFTIAAQGRVMRLEAERNELHPDLWSCVRGKLAGMRFDRATGGNEANAEFSF